MKFIGNREKYENSIFHYDLQDVEYIASPLGLLWAISSI